MTDSFYYLTESIELDLKKKRSKKHNHLAMFWNFYVGWRHNVNMYNAIYDAMKSYLTGVWDKKIRNRYITWKKGLILQYISVSGYRWGVFWDNVLQAIQKLCFF